MLYRLVCVRVGSGFHFWGFQNLCKGELAEKGAFMKSIQGRSSDLLSITIALPDGTYLGALRAHIWGFLDLET